MLVRVLGAVEIRGQSIPPSTARLLAVLCCRLGEATSTEAIEEAMWDGRPGTSVAIHTAVSRLRSLLPHGAIERRGR